MAEQAREAPPFTDFDGEEFNEDIVQGEYDDDLDDLGGEEVFASK